VTLANPSLHAGHRGLGRTAFERNLLPGFARWLSDQVAKREPDYLIPVETKGARVLEAVLRYAREELLEPIHIPVIYASALAYMDPEQLRRRRVMIVDDAVRSGASLNRHRARVERYGPTVVEALACVGDAESDHLGAECYSSVNSTLYSEYVWQLAELVVARGLPPEVDHHLFELRLPERLNASWWALESLLAGYGTLTVDGPVEKSEQLQPLTLHFPSLPGAADRPDRSLGGPHKLRFFPDPLNECIYTVPVSFPPLRLPPPEDPALAGPDPTAWRYPVEFAHERLRETLGHPQLIGDLLLDRARVIDPETIFAAISTSSEIELVEDLAAVLQPVFPGASIRVQREPFDRLYGPACAEEIFTAVADRVSHTSQPLGIGPGQPGSDLSAASAAAAGPPPFLDATIAEKTTTIADDLRSRYQERSQADDFDPSVRVGLPMGKIDELLGGDKRLLASRCVDYGLAMTTLVPFVGIDPFENGSICMQRQYRVSEPGRDANRPYEDTSGVRVALSAEMAAAISYCVSKRSSRYSDTDISEQLLASLVGILHPLVCEAHGIELCLTPGPVGEQVVLCNDHGPVGLGDDSAPELLVRGEAGVRPSAGFRERWDANDLRLDKRKSTEEIEEHVRLLVGFLDDLDPEEHRRVLRGWAMSTDRHLGLTHVRASLDAAVVDIAQPLRRALGREPHKEASALDPTQYLDAAREKLAILSSDWSAPVRHRWSTDPSKREKRALASLGAPDSNQAAAAYELPGALAELLASLVPPAQALDLASAELWDGRGEETAAQVAVAAFEVSAQIRGRLGSFVDDVEPRAAPADPREGLVAAATDLLDALEQVRALVAATAGVYRGPSDGHLHPPGELRVASILSLDLAESTARAQGGGSSYREWCNQGLNFAAQYARAVAGREGKAREGDDIWLEFPTGDAAILCAVVVQRHTAALRSAGIDAEFWRFHAGVDSGQLGGADGGNVLDISLNRATKLAKECDRESEMVFVTSEALTACSALLCDLAQPATKVTIGGEPLTPKQFDPAAVSAVYRDRLRELPALIAELLADTAASDVPLEIAAPQSQAEAATAEADG
jgi:hypothetical protein